MRAHIIPCSGNYNGRIVHKPWKKRSKFKDWPAMTGMHRRRERCGALDYSSRHLCGASPTVARVSHRLAHPLRALTRKRLSIAIQLHNQALRRF